jgi:hypothetical protein
MQGYYNLQTSYTDTHTSIDRSYERIRHDTSNGLSNSFPGIPKRRGEAIENRLDRAVENRCRGVKVYGVKVILIAVDLWGSQRRGRS